jgi:hypothetical protein
MIREGENNRVTEYLGAFVLKAVSQEMGQANQTTTKTNHAVRKAASGRNNNQNQPDPERAPAGSRPSYISQLLHLVACQGRAWNLRGRARGLIGFGSCLVACPLPDCAVFVLKFSLDPLVRYLSLNFDRHTLQILFTSSTHHAFHLRRNLFSLG